MEFEELRGGNHGRYVAEDGDYKIIITEFTPPMNVDRNNLEVYIRIYKGSNLVYYNGFIFKSLDNAKAKATEVLTRIKKETK